MGLASGHGARQRCSGLAAPGRWRSWLGSKGSQSSQDASRPVLGPEGGLGSSKYEGDHGSPQELRPAFQVKNMYCISRVLHVSPLKKWL